MDKLQLSIAVLAFLMAAILIPVSRMRLKGKGVRIWRTIALAMLVLAAALAMFAPR